EPDPAFHEHLVDHFAGRANVEILNYEVAELPSRLSPESFDTAICLNVLEHIAAHESALGVIRDLLIPGGRLLLLVPAHRFLYGSIDREVGHERRYERDSLDRLLRA